MNQPQKTGEPLNKNLAMICGTIILASILISGTILYINAKPSNKNNVVINGNNQPTKNQPTGSVKVSIDDDPVLGNKNAPVTLIEFSDFQCPFCRSFWRDTLPQIQKDYIDTGKVKFVYRDFPLVSIHPAAAPAAEAAECAEDQGKFLAMHDKIFQEQDKQGQGTVQFTADDLKKWAAQIGLNASQFNSCLDSRKYKSEVEKDTADGSSAGVTGTPAFFLGKSNSSGTIEGTLVSGAQPFSAFKVIIDEMLSK